MSADDNAPEQAREVEVVRAALLAGDDWSLTRSIERVLAALAPVRAAERQEAAREALLAAAEECERDAVSCPEECDVPSCRANNLTAARWLRDRADGVTGRSGT